MRCAFSREIIKLMDEMPPGITLLEMDYCYLSMMLRRNQGNKTWCAREVGIALRTMQKKAKEMEYHGYHVEPFNKKVTRGKTRNENI